MTTNLRLGATPGALTTAKAFTLTSSNSDVTDSFSVATSDMASSGTTSWSGAVDAKHVYLTGDATYGNYYNWYTATASTGTQNGVTSGDASASICPTSGTSGKPWKLPPNTGDGSYTNLFQTKLGWVSSTSGTDATHFGTGKTVTQAPYSFPLSGVYYGGVQNQESNGYFWFRTAYSANNAYFFGFDSSGGFNLQDYYYKYFGASVRCVLVAS